MSQENTLLSQKFKTLMVEKVPELEKISNINVKAKTKQVKLIAQEGLQLTAELISQVEAQQTVIQHLISQVESLEVQIAQWNA